jgi:hypothetical protein
VPTDVHASALLQLGRKKWFVPVKAIVTQSNSRV